MKHKKITFYEQDGTRHEVIVAAKIVPEIVQAMQRVLYPKPKGVFQIHGQTKLLLSIPGANLRAGYIIQDVTP